MIKLSLNGWQRLWIFISLIYLILILFVFYNATSPEARRELYNQKILWAVDLRETIFSAVGAVNYYQKYYYYGEQIEKDIDSNHDEGLIDDGEIILLQIDSSKYSGYIEKLRQKHNKAIDKIYYDQAIMYACIVAFWATSVLIIYFLGWCVGWIYRGFRQKQN